MSMPASQADKAELTDPEGWGKQKQERKVIGDSKFLIQKKKKTKPVDQWVRVKQQNPETNPHTNTYLSWAEGVHQKHWEREAASRNDIGKTGHCAEKWNSILSLTLDKNKLKMEQRLSDARPEEKMQNFDTFRRKHLKI